MIFEENLVDRNKIKLLWKPSPDVIIDIDMTSPLRLTFCLGVKY